MKRRSSRQKDKDSPPATKQRHPINGSLEIKDGKDGVIKRCANTSCRDIIPTCFAEVSKKCARSGVTSRWHHISNGEHYCNSCFDEIRQGNNGYSNGYKRWVSDWTSNSKSQPSHRLYIAEEILPYWVQCNDCEKWRCLPKEVELNSDNIAKFTCHNTATLDVNRTCSASEDLRVKLVQDPKWMQTLGVPPLLKHSPAARFLNLEYFMDGVGMSPTALVDNKQQKATSPEIEEIMQPFYQPNENGRALCIRPDIMEYDEVLEFAEYSREPVLYLGLRNLMVALWSMDPTHWLTPEKCIRHIICRGLVRIFCVVEMRRILSFLNLKGVINCGLLRNPPYHLLENDIRKLKVVIVGAGVAGLAAARQLHNFGAQVPINFLYLETSVTVVEARSRIGGRILDDHRLDVVVGRGAQLVTGVINNPVSVMCLQGGINYRKFNEECPLIEASSGCLVPVKNDKRVDFHFNALLDAVEDWRKQAKKDESLAGMLKLMHRIFLQQTKVTFSKEEENLLHFHLSNLEYSCGAPLDDVSSLNWDQNEHFAQFAGVHALMTEGYSAVIDRLAEGIDIRLENEITKIDYSGSSIKVFGRGSGKPIVCNKVLITLPLAIMQQRKVTFVPDLPLSKLNAISALGAGIIEKIALKFPTKFWDSVNGADYFGNVPGDVDSKNYFNIFYDFSTKDDDDDDDTKEPSYVLMSYLSGKAASMVRFRTDEEIVALAVHSLRKLFPNEDVPEPDNYLVTHWSEDIFAGMSYSYVKVGSSGSDYDVMADAVDNKVFFAGEATNRHFPQTVTGAYLSGLREASKIVNSYQG